MMQFFYVRQFSLASFARKYNNMNFSADGMGRVRQGKDLVEQF